MPRRARDDRHREDHDDARQRQQARARERQRQRHGAQQRAQRIGDDRTALFLHKARVGEHERARRHDDAAHRQAVRVVKDALVARIAERHRHGDVRPDEERQYGEDRAAQNRAEGRLVVARGEDREYHGIANQQRHALGQPVLVKQPGNDHHPVQRKPQPRHAAMEAHPRLAARARRQRHEGQKDHAEEHEDHPAHREFALREEHAVADERKERRGQQPRIEDLVEDARHPVVELKQPRAVNAFSAHVFASKYLVSPRS